MATEPEGIDAFEIGLFVALGAAVIAVLVFYVEAVFFDVEGGIDFKKRVAAVAQYKSAVSAEQTDKMTTYAWRDRALQRVSIPLDRAMALVVAEQSAAQRAGAPKP